jgi:hypothetical protein
MEMKNTPTSSLKVNSRLAPFFKPDIDKMLK